MTSDAGGRAIRILTVVACAAFAAVPAAAQRGGAAAGFAGGASSSDLRATDRFGPVRIDGRLDEAAWSRAEPITDFVQGEPVEGASPDARTEVRLLFDEDAIYVGARLYEPSPGRIAHQLVRRDETGQADYFQASFDSNRDRRTGYEFRVTAAGVQWDAYVFDDNQQDVSWNAVWDSKVQRHEHEWVVEMRIPWSQIRYEPSDTSQTWGVNFQRWRVGAGERTYYALIPRSRHGRVSFFRTISGIRAPSGRRRVEIRPYALGRTVTGPAEAGDPFFSGRATEAAAGADIRYGLGSAFTLDATVNPDFGQVELDPAVINLSAFETFFPEKRPFFVEDARILSFDLSGHRSSLFYSRRIGRAPQGSAPDGAEFVDAPSQSTILGAAKLTGRSTGGLSVGGLVAVTAEERGRALVHGSAAVAADTLSEYLAQPRGYYGVARLRQDFRQGATAVGGIVTAVRRMLPASGEFDFMPSAAYTGGLDFEHMWGDRAWALVGFVAASSVRGDSAALIAIQESSNHYFQRPDSDFRVDSTRTALTGIEWRLELQRRSGRHWTGAAWMGEVTPRFEVNDLGYSGASERLGAGGRATYREIQPGPVFRDFALSASIDQAWRHSAVRRPLSPAAWDRSRKNGSVSASARGTFNSFWSAGLDARYTPARLDDAATRGGPLMLAPASAGTGAWLHTDPRSPLRLDARLSYNRGRAGRAVDGGLGLTIRPTSGWELQLEPRYSVRTDAAQYVDAFPDGSFRATYGDRYIFGDLDRRSLALETRLNVTFTPDLTLQLFAQPLLEAGQFTAYKQLAEAGSFRFRDLPEGAAVSPGAGGDVACVGGATCSAGGERYVDFNGDGAIDATFEDGDFNVVSLRGNAVLRWQYQPGSTLFLVWQQHRYGDRAFGDLDPARDGRDMFRLQPDNVFIVKINYWIGA